MADLSVLLRFLSDSSQAKADSASLRQQVGADLNAITAQSKAGSVETSKAMQRTAIATTQALAVTTREVNSTGLAFAQTARLASSAGRGIENIFAGNVLAAMRNFSMASRTAFNPNGPLAFASAVNSISRETKEAEVLVARFSSVLGSASKNVEGALNKTLFNDFGITAEKALLNPSLAAQKFVSQLALITDAEERAIAVSNVFGASTARVLPTIEAMVAVEQRAAAIASEYEAAETSLAGAEAHLSFEQNELALAQERLTLARQSSFTTSAELVVAEEAVATATAEVAVAETEATAATEALAAAEAELAAAQVEVAASSGFSAGAIGLVVIAVAALVYGIYKWLTAQREVIIVTKDQIEASQRRVELARQELESVERLSVATEGERQKREALIAAKKEELQLSLDLQKAQEYAVVVALSNALQNEAQNRKKLIEAEQLQQGNWLTEGPSLIAREAIILKINEALGKSQEETKKAAQAADILSAATGKTKEELFASALAHAKETDAAGQTQHAYTELAHTLGYLVDAQGRLIPSTDAATIALRNQIGVLADLSAQAKKTKTDLDNISNARNTYIEGRVANIVAIANGNLERARRLIKDSLKTDPDFAYQVQQKRGDEAVEKAIHEQLFPREKKQRSKKPRDDQGSTEMRTSDQANQEVLEKMRASREKLAEEYNQGKRDRESYYDLARAELKTTTLDALANLQAEEVIAEGRIKNQEKLDLKLAEISKKRQKITDDADKEKRRLDAEQNKDEIEAAIAQLKEKDDILKFYEDKQLKTAEEQQKLGLITDEQIEDLRYEQRAAQLERRLELLNKEREAYGEYATEYIKLTHDIDMAERQRADDAEENQRRMLRETYGKDIGLPDGKGKGPLGTESLDEFNKMMNMEPPPVFIKTISLMHELKNLGKEAFGGIIQGTQSMIETMLIAGNVGPAAFARLAKGVIAGLAAQAIVHSIMEVAYAIAEYAKAASNPTTAPMHIASAHLHLLSALKFGIVGGVAAGVSLAIPGGGSSVAGNTFAGSDGNNNNNGPQYRPFNYGSGNFSASEANASGSRTGNLIERLIASNEKVVAGQQQVVAGNMLVVNHVAALREKIDSVPGGDLIRANPNATGDALQEAFQRSHPVTKDVTSLGSTGRA